MLNQIKKDSAQVFGFKVMSNKCTPISQRYHLLTRCLNSDVLLKICWSNLRVLLVKGQVAIFTSTQSTDLAPVCPRTLCKGDAEDDKAGPYRRCELRATRQLPGLQLEHTQVDLHLGGAGVHDADGLQSLQNIPVLLPAVAHHQAVGVTVRRQNP